METGDSSNYLESLDLKFVLGRRNIGCPLGLLFSFRWKDRATAICRIARPDPTGSAPTEAIRIFYRQISLRGGLPFPVAIPNELTASTLEKSRHGEDVQEFESLEAMFKNWEK